MVYYIYREKSGYWRWRLIDAKGMTIVNSGERYAEEGHCSAAVDLIKTSGVAPVCVLRSSLAHESGVSTPTPPMEESFAAGVAVTPACLH